MGHSCADGAYAGRGPVAPSGLFRSPGSRITRFMAMTVLDWLLDSDPAIRWQALRDLADAADDVVATERARVAMEGWGARLLAQRDPDGQWAGGACFLAVWKPTEEGGQPWMSTLPTLVLLRDLGLSPDSVAARQTVALVRENCRWEWRGQRFLRRRGRAVHQRPDRRPRGLLLPGRRRDRPAVAR